MNKERQPFYLKTWFLILMFMIPPVFLILIWKRTRSNKLQVGLNVFYVCVFITALIFNNHESRNNGSAVITSSNSENNDSTVFVSKEEQEEQEEQIIISATESSKEQATSILSILRNAGVKSILSVKHDDMLDDVGTKGYRVESSELTNVILYLNEQKQVYSIRYAGNYLYSINTNDLKTHVINVKEPPYNLKGDGTDETKSIQALLDLAKSKGSVSLYFPKGVYGMSGYLRMYKNTNIQMSKDTVIKRLGKGNNVFVNGEFGNKTYATGYNGEGNIHFNGGTIDLNSKDAPIRIDKNISAFDIGHGNNISFSNMTIKNGQNGHYFQISSSANIRFKNCIFKDVYHNSSINNMNYELIQIETANKRSFPTFGGYDLTISKNITIDNCIFKNVIRAIGTHGDGKYGTEDVIYSKNIRIQNCKFKNSIDNMLNLTAYDNVVLKNNKIENAGGHGIYALHVKNSVISGNTIINTQKSSILERNSTITIQDLQSVTVNKNR
ncbi:right-handed parallel beta-helix repeat-containing protein [Gottfriedia acidiceleris]|uniref:right-handed parallel beta-helix repeat-containing protein n=1 Tax=Gottfriedia acidiceleris TaxID=371036 RepID=UPI000B43916D|nr:right-handed parallel beta-helix repeat-containing protein [Gottfriedia acidiceleris]